MTYLEKLKMDHLNVYVPDEVIIKNSCPSDFGLEEPYMPCTELHTSCVACWDREFPENKED